MHNDEKTHNQKLETLLEYVPIGAERVYSSNHIKELFVDTPEKTEQALSAVKELKAINDLGQLYLETKDERIPNKIGEYLAVWNEKYQVNIEINTSPIDERYFYSLVRGTLQVWDELSDEAKKNAEEIATKIVTNQLAYHSKNNHVDTAKHDNFSAYTNMIGLAATSILIKTNSDLSKESLDVFINGNFKSNIWGFFEQTDKNIREDGSSEDFHVRDSVHYHIFNQTAWERSLKICEYLNIEVPEEVRAKIENAREFALKFIKGNAKHIEYLNSHNRNDARRYADKRGLPFDPETDKHTVNEFYDALEQEFVS